MQQVTRGKQQVGSTNEQRERRKQQVESSKQQVARRKQQIPNCFAIKLIHLVLIKLYSFQFRCWVSSLLFWVGGWWLVAGFCKIKANSTQQAQLQLELGLSMAKVQRKCKDIAKIVQRYCKEITKIVQRQCKDNAKIEQRQCKDSGRKCKNSARIVRRVRSLRCIVTFHLFKLLSYSVSDRVDPREAYTSKKLVFSENFVTLVKVEFALGKFSLQWTKFEVEVSQIAKKSGTIADFFQL